MFTSFETFLSVEYVLSFGQVAGSCETPLCDAIRISPPAYGGPFGALWNYSIPLSISGWTLVGVFLWRKQTVKEWKGAGFTKDVYDLMNRMRGSNSRLTLLRSMVEPKHRQELSELTGIDWKEVDRELSILATYGLVQTNIQSGSVKLYQLTEHGKVLLRLMDVLQKGSP